MFNFNVLSLLVNQCDVEFKFVLAMVVTFFVKFTLLAKGITLARLSINLKPDHELKSSPAFSRHLSQLMI